MYLIYQTATGIGQYTDPATGGEPSIEGLSGLSIADIPDNFQIGPYGCTWLGNRVVNNPAPTPVAPTLAQTAAAALGAGLTLSLSGSLVLGETNFPVDPETQSKIGAVATTINTTGGFPGGAGNYPMKDSAGAWHTFTISQYKAVAGAIAAYVASLYLIIDGNPLGQVALPAPTASLVLS